MTVPVLLIMLTASWMAVTPAMVLVADHGAVHGRRALLATVAGLATGVLVWALLGALLLHSLVAQSGAVQLGMRVVGALVLVGLAANCWWRFRSYDGDVAGRPALSPVTAFAQGLLLQLVVPRVFALESLPIFAFTSAPEDLVLNSTGLALLQMIVDTTLYLLLGLGAAWLVARFGSPSTARWVEAASAGLLLAAAVWVAVVGGIGWFPQGLDLLGDPAGQ